MSSQTADQPPPESSATSQPSSPQQSETTSTTPSRVKRMSSAVEKTVEKTVDRLSKSISGKAAQTSPASPPSGHRRLFSLSRKGKAKEVASLDVEDASSPASIPSAASSRPASPELLTRSTPTVLSHDSPQLASPRPTKSLKRIDVLSDDSPFITPPSPPPRFTWSPFRGDGSMRPGTQTLIQALHALPWTDTETDDDATNTSPAESGDEDDQSKEAPLASSIHTIHRPLARSRRLSAQVDLLKGTSYPPLDEELSGDQMNSDEEPDAEDFEETPKLPDLRPAHVHQGPLVNIPESSNVTKSFTRAIPVRQGSMATVRVQRRTRLAAKLKDVFELDGIEEVWAEMPCWLLRSILLQGYMYLTNNYLCFFAHMPSREDQVIKSGSLSKKAQRTKRWVKHWFMLKNDALSWYQSSSDPYFPHGIIDLRYAISCDPVAEKGFRLRTNQKVVHLSADSVPSRDEWVKAIRKVMFKAQNMGDTVKIAIPYSAILDVDKSSAMDFSETIEVKVLDEEEHYSIDSYFFAYFHDIQGALEQIRDALRANKILPEPISPQPVLDTTVSRHAITAQDRAASSPPENTPTRPTSVFRFTSLLKPLQDTLSRPTPQYQVHNSPESEEFTHISRRTNSSSFVPVTTSPRAMEGRSNSSPEALPARESGGKSTSYDHTESSSWNVGIPSWLKSSRRVLGYYTASEQTLTPTSAHVTEIYSSLLPSISSSRGNGDLAFSILETPSVAIDPETVEKFHAAFAYDEKETLLGYFSGYLYRLLPISGRLYISTNYFCFKSTGALAARTRMTLPVRDILATEKSKATAFGHHGVVVIVKGHEELFFEFSAEDKRDAFVRLLNCQIDETRKRLLSGDLAGASPSQHDALILEEFDTRPIVNEESDRAVMSESMTDSLPAVMFTSASSTFLTFKPAKPLHFTFLTIGSRGDVQPYIALAKGLLADGHRCRIATHGEFKEWIESHGIEFGYVGGDPAELMRICVENGTFTVSFLKEGLLKFRGWVDDLLKTSWEACQGTDILVESPSAMGGYHIAEALGIPYFRAFTMTWSRTRAYPHAFAVPERKMGGSYNYMSYVMFDQVFWRATAGQINRWRRNILGLEGTSLDKMEPHKIPFLYNFSPHVVPPPLDWPEWIRITGYWFLDDADVSAKKWSPPEDLVKFIDTAHNAGKKVVYIGFGSIVVSDPKSMTQCVVDAVMQSGVYAILSKGWSDRLHVKSSDAAEPEEPLPHQIYPISSIPHDWLFQRIDAACHHGGAGTTGASLRAGIPTIIKPFFGDQFFWADRVEALGVGSAVRKLTVDALVESLITATTDVKQVERARLLGEQIRAENGVSTAIESIYRDLEYARSLIKRTSVENRDQTDTDQSSGKDMDKSYPSHSGSGYSSAGSANRAPSEDWSVISEQDDRERRSSVGSLHSDSRQTRDSAAKLTSRSARRRSLSLSP